MKKKPTYFKTRKFSLVSYLPREKIEAIININDRMISRYAYILHDKDKDEQPHFTIILYTYQATTISAVRRWFYLVDSSQNTLAQAIKDETNAYDYLTHANDPDKYQYNVKEITSKGFNFFHPEEDDDRSYKILTELYLGVPLMELARRYKKDFIYRYRAYKELLEDIKFQENLEKFKKTIDKDIF